MVIDVLLFLQGIFEHAAKRKGLVMFFVAGAVQKRDGPAPREGDELVQSSLLLWPP
jgi:hypothetical protein